MIGSTRKPHCGIAAFGAQYIQVVVFAAKVTEIGFNCKGHAYVYYLLECFVRLPTIHRTLQSEKMSYSWNILQSWVFIQIPKSMTSIGIFIFSLRDLHLHADLCPAHFKQSDEQNNPYCFSFSISSKNDEHERNSITNSPKHPFPTFRKRNIMVASDLATTADDLNLSQPSINP